MRYLILCFGLAGCVFSTRGNITLTGIDRVQPEPCLGIADCKGGRLCINGFCTSQVACKSTAECDPGTICNADGYCAFAETIRGSGAACLETSECQRGFSCVDKKCTQLACTPTVCFCAEAGTCDPGTCIPEPDAAVCARSGFDCGGATATDNCGTSRTIACGACALGKTCGQTTPNKCGCAQTNAELCGARNCGKNLNLLDACAEERLVPFCGVSGDCPADQNCQSISSTCVCNETEAQLCTRLGWDCGASVAATDRCGFARTVTCGALAGACGTDMTCGTNTANVCACDETDQQMCLRFQFNCGAAQAVDRCGFTRNIDCGPACAFGTECLGNRCQPLCDAPFGSPAVSYEVSCADRPNCGGVQDAMQTVSGDGRTVIAGRSGGCGISSYVISDRPAPVMLTGFTSQAMTVPGTVRIEEASLSIMPNRLNVVALAADQLSLVHIARPDTTSGTFSVVADTLLANVNSFLAGLPGTYYFWAPVLTPDGLLLYVTVTAAPGNSYYTDVDAGNATPNRRSPEGFYVARRGSTASQFGTPQRLPDSDALADSAWMITGASNDELTLYMLDDDDDATGNQNWRTRVFSRPFTNQSYGAAVDFPALFRAKMTANCRLVVGNIAQEGCSVEELGELTR